MQFRRKRHTHLLQKQSISEGYFISVEKIKLKKKDAILCFGQEIIWNNTHIRANQKKTIMYTTWYDLV